MALLVLSTLILQLPVVAATARFFTLRGDQRQRSNLWIRHCHANQALCVVVVSLWCGFCELSIPKAPFVFWLVPAVSMAFMRAIRLAVSKKVLASRWTLSDSFRIVFWATVSPTAPLLMIASGMHNMLAGSYWGMAWFPAAGIIALVGTVRLRSAQGLKLRRVKSGTLFNRVMHLSRRVGIRIEYVYVVPSGRGDLTNAFASWRGVALTDNFGEYLRGTELDSVIAHELGHVQGHHTRKRLLVLSCVVVAVCLLSPAVRLAAAPYQAVFVSLSLITMLLANCCASRHYEYECDRKAVEFTRSPQSMVRALVALYEKTNSAAKSSRIVELFDSHPSLAHRVQAIAKAAGLPSEDVSELLSREPVSQ